MPQLNGPKWRTLLFLKPDKLHKHHLIHHQLSVLNIKEYLLTWPTEWRCRSISIWLTITHTWPIRRNQTQLQGQSQLIIERRDVSRQAHSNAAEDGIPFGVTNFGKRDRSPSLRMPDLLRQSRRAQICINGIVNRVCTARSFIHMDLRGFARLWGRNPRQWS